MEERESEQPPQRLLPPFIPTSNTSSPTPSLLSPFPSSLPESRRGSQDSDMPYPSSGIAFSPFVEWADSHPSSDDTDDSHTRQPSDSFALEFAEGIITPPASNSRSSTPLGTQPSRTELIARRTVSTQGLSVQPILVESRSRHASPSRSLDIPSSKEGTLGPPFVSAKSNSRSSSISARTAINMPVIEMRRSSSIDKTSYSPRGRSYKDAISSSRLPTVQKAHKLALATLYYLRQLDRSHAWLALYLTCAISQTISNKTLLRSFFPFPWLLTVCQMIWGTLGTMAASKGGFYRTVRLSPRKETILYAIGLLFSIELLASNVSLRLVAVPYHLSVRALSPLLTLLFSVVFFRQQTTLRTSSCLLLVFLGVVFTSHNLEIISLGSLLTILSMLLSSAKTIITSRLLFDKYHLHPLDLLSRMSLLGIGPGMIFAVGNGELGKLWAVMGKPDEFTKGHLAAIAMNGALSFILFVVTLAAEKNTRQPMMNIAGHVAQAVTVIVAVILFGLSLSPTNFVGVALTLSGGVLYARNDALDSEESEGTHQSDEKLLPD